MDHATPLVTPWQHCFRVGFAPQMTSTQLAALRDACTADDPRLIQGATTTPPPLQCVQDWPCDGACAVTYTGLMDGLITVGECADYFGILCSNADRNLGEEAGCRHFLHWFDETPRDEMRRQLAAECERILAERADDAEPRCNVCGAEIPDARDLPHGPFTHAACLPDEDHDWPEPIPAPVPPLGWDEVPAGLDTDAA